MSSPGHASHLSDAKYSYDLVVATTQASINSTILAYMAGAPPNAPTIAVYVADAKGNPLYMDYHDLLTNARGSDPFKINTKAPGFDATTDKDCQNLVKARFMFGFSMTPGIPPNSDPASIPDVVTLGTDAKSVNYKLLCSDFRIAVWQNNGYAPPSFKVISQDDENAVWQCQANVDLRMSAVEQGAFSKLPPDVQKGIKNLGSQAFSIQQLLFDLNSASLMSVPKISGLAEGSIAKGVLNQSLCDIYFDHMKTNGQPVLNTALIARDPDPSAFRPTDMTLHVCPLLNSDGSSKSSPSSSEQQATTLNYLCSSFGDRLPDPKSFNWNWVEANQISQYDGVVAINRNTFIRWLLNAGLMEQAKRSCIAFDAKCWPDGGNIGFGLNPSSGQTPTIQPEELLPACQQLFGSLAGSGTPLVVDRNQGRKAYLWLHYDHTSHNGAGLKDVVKDRNILGEINTNSQYDCAVFLAGNTITIVQNLTCNLYVRHLESHASGDVIQKTIIDTYTLKVGEAGAMLTTLSSDIRDGSENLSTNSFTNIFTNLGNIVGDLKRSAGAVATSLTDIPMSKLQGFMFPGGRTFTFNNFNFSDYGDLTAAISYADPTAAQPIAHGGSGGGGATSDQSGKTSSRQAAVYALADQLRQQGLLFCGTEPRRQAVSVLQDGLRQQGLLFC